MPICSVIRLSYILAILNALIIRLYQIHCSQTLWFLSIKCLALRRFYTEIRIGALQVMFVFTKEDAQYEALTWAAEKMHYACSLSTTTEEAIENFFNERPHLVFIDARGKGTMDPTALCRYTRALRRPSFFCHAEFLRNIVPTLSARVAAFYALQRSFVLSLHKVQ
ncbi:hypothetical protein MRX96_010581 [Rhipicephalus microplus]